MTHETRRRLHLGLPIHGPFSRNRRRHRLDLLDYIAIGCAAAALGFLTLLSLI